jgi:hypothetical protein
MAFKDIVADTPLREAFLQAYKPPTHLILNICISVNALLDLFRAITMTR